MKIAVIPARGGSKRIPNKNIKEFAGKSIIEYSISVALKSELFDKVIVSTDSEKIAAIAIRAGAEVPFMRPKELSDDHTPTAPVIEHALKWAEKTYGKINIVCCIYSTAPFIRICDLLEGYTKLIENRVSSVFSVTSFPFSIFRSLKIDNGDLKMFWPEHELTRSQDLPEAYHDAGMFYWLDAKSFLIDKKLYTNNMMPVIIPRVLVQDIDTPEDWETAEVMYETCKKRGLL